MAGGSRLPELCVDPPSVSALPLASCSLRQAMAWCNGAAGGKKLQKGLRLEPGAPGCCAGLLPVPDCPRAASEAGAAVCPCCPGEVG